MIIFLFALITLTSASSGYKLINDNFIVDITNTGIILDNKYNINYELLKETKTNYNKLYFNKFNTGMDCSINYISSKIKKDKLNINFLHEISSNNTVFMNDIKRVVKYDNNKLYVSMFIDNWEFESFNNDLFFEFSINAKSKLSNSSITFNDFTIDLNKECIVDGHDVNINISNSLNKYKIKFPFFENHLYYDFVIQLV
jgi:hypothetical protein